VTVGFDIAEHDPAEWGIGDATLVHVDSEPAEVYEEYNPEIELVADVGRTLEAITGRYRHNDVSYGTGWYSGSRQESIDSVERDPEPEAPFTVRGVLPALREAIAPSDVLLSDVGSQKRAIAQNFPTYEPDTCMISNGLASMGIAVPGAVAADIAVETNVVAATGDGGFLMSAAEIGTATRAGCGFTIVVFNDNDYGLISEKQRSHTGESFGTGLGNPDRTAFAESVGIDGYRPESATQLREALDTAIGDGMSLIEGPVARISSHERKKSLPTDSQPARDGAGDGVTRPSFPGRVPVSTPR